MTDSPEANAPRNSEEPIREIVLNPAWSIGTLMIDNNPVPYVKFDHPQHGWLHFHISPDSLLKLRGGIDQVTQQIGAIAQSKRETKQ